MFTDETNTEAELDNQAEEAATDAGDTSTDDSASASSSDPLDSMDDAQIRAFALGIGKPLDESLSGEDLLKEAKKYRAIHNRKERKDTTEPTSTDDVLRRSDFEKSREKEAKETLSDANDPVLSDIRENWTSIAEFYVPRNGRDTVQGILKDMRIARAAYREANPVQSDDPARTAAHTAGTSGRSPKAVEPQKKRLMPRRTSIDSWYGKKT